MLSSKLRLLVFTFIAIGAAALFYDRFSLRGREHLVVESSKPGKTDRYEPESTSQEALPAKAVEPQVEAAPTEAKAPVPALPARPQLAGSNSGSGLAFLAEALRASTRDTWRERALREQIEKSFAHDAASVELRMLQCNADLCRVDLALAASADAGKDAFVDMSEIMQRLATMAPHGDMVITTNSAVAENGTAVAFIARYGTVLPHTER